MRKLIFAAASVAFLASGVSAFAADQIEGTVQKADPASGTLVLQSGQSFQFANGSVLYGLLPGQPVGVSYNGTQGVGAFNPHPASADNSDAY
ncbi:DUF2147 domain-containing protein [Kaistia algarum]|uniref:hypothetical protein n=1 Tax=Kaistia algarum TaxID=2083279 RepID=UPI00225302A6|nr:hypothetical protein [Kaistia algarum]MCX5514229.1 hypothetical protein [Kaistia algarum]